MRPKPKYSPVGLFECTSSIRERSAGPCRYATLPCHVPPLGVVSLRSYVSVVDHVPERKLISFSISRWGLGIMPSPLAACFVAAVLWVASPAVSSPLFPVRPPRSTSKVLQRSAMRASGIASWDLLTGNGLSVVGTAFPPVWACTRTRRLCLHEYNLFRHAHGD